MQCQGYCLSPARYAWQTIALVRRTVRVRNLPSDLVTDAQLRARFEALIGGLGGEPAVLSATVRAAAQSKSSCLCTVKERRCLFKGLYVEQVHR